MNTGGLNGSWVAGHQVQLGDMAAHLAAGIRHSPRRPVLPGSLFLRAVMAVLCLRRN